MDAGALMRLPVDRSSPRPSTRRQRTVHPPRPPHHPRPLDVPAQERAVAFTHLAYQLAWWFARNTARDVPADELISEALFGLTYAAGRYDEDRHVPFGAYANMVIRHRLIQTVIRWRDRRFAPLPEWSESSGEPWEAADYRPTPDLCARAAASELCDRVRRALPPRWYKALRLYYSDGLTLEEVGLRLGISRQRVAQVIIKATELAREALSSP